MEDDKSHGASARMARTRKHVRAYLETGRGFSIATNKVDAQNEYIIS
jgi:hypothetical protein